MATRLEVNQGSEEWLKLRRALITATDWPKIKGSMKKYGWTQRKLYKHKMEGLETPVNAAMQRGSYLEKEAREVISRDLHLDLEPACYMSEEYPHMMASLDAWQERTKVLIEIKCPGEKVFNEAKAGNVPEYWLDQVNFQMIVMGLTSMSIAVYESPTNYFMIECSLDENEKVRIVKETLDFYEYMKTLTEPPIDADDYVEINDKEAVKAFKEWREAFEALKLDTEKVKALLATALEYTDDGNSVIPKARARVRVSSRTTFDWKKFVEDKKIPDEEVKEYFKLSFFQTVEIIKGD